MDNHDMIKMRDKLERIVLKYNMENHDITPDLIDIYEISNKLITIIDDVSDGKYDNDELANKFIELQIELYYHMIFHLKSLRSPLSKMINNIMENIDDQDE